MKLTCPNCHETLSLAALIEHDAAREAIRLALEFPAPLGKQLMQYVSLFKPQQRALSMDRFASILTELMPMIQAAQIERNGRIWPAPQSYWSQAFDAVWLSKGKLTLPLKSHGYLLEILVGFANKAEARAEAKHEQGRKFGEPHHVNAIPAVVAPAAVKKPKSVMPENVKQTLKKLTGGQHGN
jgi:hypothetical protein